MKKTLLITFSFFVLCMFVIGQQKPFVQIQQCFGGEKGNPFPFVEKIANCVQPTKDSGFITFCNSHTTVCTDDDCNYYQDYYQDFLIKKKADGSIQWQKGYSGKRNSILHEGQQTSDGGYIAAGEEFDYDENFGDFQNEDFLIVKFDNEGNPKWQKTFGGSDQDIARSIRQTPDGGYIITGKTFSHDGDVTGNNGINACWIIKINSSGNIQWQKCYGASGRGEGKSVRPTQDGGFIIAGLTDDRGWIFKTDNLGNVLWQKREPSIFSSIQQTNDGGYIVGGTSDHDALIVKFDNAGNKLWQKTYGGTNVDEINSILQTRDNGYIAAGYTNSKDGDVDFGRAGGNFWVIRTDNVGQLLWNQTYGGNDFESANSICNTLDKGYVVAGNTRSEDKYIFGENKSEGAWIIKLSPENLDDSLHLNPYHKVSNCAAANDISCSLTNSNTSYTIRLYRFGVLYDSVLNVIGHTGFHNLPFGAYYATATTIDRTINCSSQVDIMPSPHNLNSISLSASKEKLNWQIINCADDYSIQFREQDSSKWKTREALDSSGSYTLRDLKPSTTYVWKVASEKWANGIKATGNYSDSAIFTTAPTSAFIADNLKSTNIGSTPLIVLPNPAKHYFIINYKSNIQQKANATLYDVNGKAVWSSGLINSNALNGKYVNATPFAKGVFYLKIINENGELIASTKIEIAD